VNWLTKVSGDISNIPDFISHFENEYAQAKWEVSIKGSIEKNLSALPGVTEHRFNQLQEIEAVLNHLNVQLRKIKRKHFQKYLEAYNRALTDRTAEKYADGEAEVIDFEGIINSVALLRNQYLGLLKGLESKNFMLGHLVKLKTAGMEDYTTL
jgi:hypothetical protein